MKKRILFVDDEPQVLQGLRRMLHVQAREWELHFAISGPQALEKTRMGRVKSEEAKGSQCVWA